MEVYRKGKKMSQQQRNRFDPSRDEAYGRMIAARYKYDNEKKCVKYTGLGSCGTGAAAGMLTGLAQASGSCAAAGPVIGYTAAGMAGALGLGACAYCGKLYNDKRLAEQEN